MGRRDERGIMEAVSKNPNIRRVELATAPGMAQPLSDLISIVFAGLFLGGVLGLLGLTTSGTERASWGFAIGAVSGSVLFGAYILSQRLQKDTFDYTPAGQQPTEPAPFIETLNQGHRREIVLFPAGWDMATMRRYAQHAQTADGYDIAYNKRPAWVTEDMLKAFRAWLAERGYGTEQDATRPWLWYDEGIEFMDGLTTSSPPRRTTPPTAISQVQDR